MTGGCFDSIFIPTDEEVNSPSFTETPEFLCVLVAQNLRAALFKKGGSFYWRFCCGRDRDPERFKEHDSPRTVYRIEGQKSLPDIIRDAEEKGDLGELTRVQDWRAS